SLRLESVWPAPAQSLAAEAHLARILIAALRARLHQACGPGMQRGPRAQLVARFRDVLDQHFRSGWSCARYARQLSVSPRRLRTACLEVTGKPPMRLVHERVLLEAQRSLTYSNLTVCEIAYELGFVDPGYFSRFFAQRVGESPARFRHRTARASPAAHRNA